MNEAVLHDIIESNADGILVVDRQGTLRFANAAAAALFGRAKDDLVDHPFGFPLGTPDKPIEIDLLHKDRVITAEMRTAIMPWAGQPAYIVSLRDITERKQVEEKMAHMGNYDALTGLPNRNLFNDRLAQEIKKANRFRLKLALLFIDLDHFKEVNDTLGHGIGDILLAEVARRLEKCVRRSDTVARVGGDEFTVILPEIHDNDGVERVVRSILRKLAESFQLEDKAVRLSCSIGVAHFPDDARGMKELIRNADKAMYAAKNGGRNRACRYESAAAGRIA